MPRRPAANASPFKFAGLLALSLAGLLAPIGAAQAQATRYVDAPPLLLGAAWYPEQWPEAKWDRDLALMEAAHINLVRIGEFAWSRMEPREGQYDFAWLDHAIAAAARHHIVVVLGTPTAAPPAWLTQKYPDTLRMDENGVRDEHGNRQQFSFASRRYRSLAHAIAEQMARRYGHNPDVVGWQLDNEYAADSFDPEVKQQFHAWLARKYGSIAALNERWATAYWSQTYDDFAQIPVRAAEENPALLLDWKRFVSDTWKDYSINQVDAIRPLADPRQFITTNTMGWFAGFDAYTVHQAFDIAAWDDYVAGERYDWIDNAARHDLTRGYKQRNFWVMETQPGFVNWRTTNVALRKGEVRDMAWQAIGHGADAVEYWQWRAAPNGQEEYHGTLVGADGEPVPVYDEIAQVGAEFALAGKALAGTTPHADVALVNDFDSRWALGFQRHSADFDPVNEMKAFYRPLRARAQVVDIVSAMAPLAGYKLVVAPSLNVLTNAQAARLKAYVEQGGHLVLGPRSGMKNADDGLHPQRQPGPLAELLGGRVEQFYALDKPVPVVDGAASAGSASIWAEQLKASAAQTGAPLRYGPSNGWLDGQPAVLTRRIGKGSITYVGAWLDDALLDRLAAGWLKDSAVAAPIPGAPADVEVCVRGDATHRVVVLINHGSQPQQVTLPAAMTPLFGAGNGVAGTVVNLDAGGVAVLQGRG